MDKRKLKPPHPVNVCDGWWLRTEVMWIVIIEVIECMQIWLLVRTLNSKRECDTNHFLFQAKECVNVLRRCVSFTKRGGSFPPAEQTFPVCKELIVRRHKLFLCACYADFWSTLLLSWFNHFTALFTWCYRFTTLDYFKCQDVHLCTLVSFHGLIMKSWIAFYATVYQ